MHQDWISGKDLNHIWLSQVP